MNAINTFYVEEAHCREVLRLGETAAYNFKKHNYDLMDEAFAYANQLYNMEHIKTKNWRPNIVPSQLLSFFEKKVRENMTSYEQDDIEFRERLSIVISSEVDRWSAYYCSVYPALSSVFQPEVSLDFQHQLFLSIIKQKSYKSSDVSFDDYALTKGCMTTACKIRLAYITLSLLNGSQTFYGLHFILDWAKGLVAGIIRHDAIDALAELERFSSKDI